MAADERRNTLLEPMSEQMWYELYRRAVAELAGGKEQFSALFASNQFDMAITFRKFPHGALRRAAEQQAPRPPESTSS